MRWATVSGFSSRCRTFISVCNQPATQGQLSLPSLRGWYMSTSFGWEGKDRYGSFRYWMNAGCAGKTEIPWERVPYLSALEVFHDKALYKSKFSFTLRVPVKGCPFSHRLRYFLFEMARLGASGVAFSSGQTWRTMRLWLHARSLAGSLRQSQVGEPSVVASMTG